MSRHTDNLERLRNRLQLCYGKEDNLVIQLQQEIALLKTNESQNFIQHDWTICYQKFLDSHLSLHDALAR